MKLCLFMTIVQKEISDESIQIFDYAEPSCVVQDRMAANFRGPFITMD